MYGGTGCGKTFIMDLFYEVVPIKKKKRVHFSNFMIDIHKRLHRLKSSSKGSSKVVGDNIMEKITNELMEEAYLLCFDEFQVTDIADAMIIKVLPQPVPPYIYKPLIVLEPVLTSFDESIL